MKAARGYRHVKDKFGAAGWSQAAAETVDAPRVRQCPVQLEAAVEAIHNNAIGTRVVAIIHCNNPASRVGPYAYGDRHRVVQLPRPANYHVPADANMADISADEVYRALKEVW